MEDVHTESNLKFPTVDETGDLYKYYVGLAQSKGTVILSDPDVIYLTKRILIKSHVLWLRRSDNSG